MMKCCICGKEISHPIIEDYLGNNPWPVSKDPDARCCDACNDFVVIPERIRIHVERRNNG